MKYQLTYKPFGNKAILIAWPEQIDLDILDDILRVKRNLESNLDGVLELIPAYNSLTVIFKLEIPDFTKIIEDIKSFCASNNYNEEILATTWKIPVCYDPSFGVDQNDLSEKLNLTKSELIQLHSAPIYTVYFIGFLPGFLYLGGLNDALHVPRKPKPRLDVFKGAVAIGGSQTGIYPNKSAGGWHIIGKTPISFFDVTKKSPCFAKSGDKIKFVPVDKSQFEAIAFEIENNKFTLNSLKDD